MKNYLLLLFVFIICNSAIGQERYFDKVFEEVKVTDGMHYATNVSIISIVLGQSPDPAPEDLLLDIYEPIGDTLAERPVVIFAHRGDFLPAIVNQSPYGTRKDSAVVEFCRELAKRGFVAVSIDYRLGWNPFGSDIEIKKTVLEAVYRITQDLRSAVRFFRKTAAEDGNPFKIDASRIAVGGFDAAGYAANNVAYLKTTDQVLLPKFLDFSMMPSLPFIIPEVHGDPYGVEEALLNIPNHIDYSSDVSAVIDFEGGLGDISWIEEGDPPTITFQQINKFNNAGIRDVTIGVGGSIIIAEGAFPDTIVHTTQTLGNQDVFLNNVEIDDLTEKARAATGGLEGLYLYTPFTQEGSVQCDPTAGVPAVNYGGNTYAWNWYDEATFGAIWDMVPGQTIPSDLFICQYNTGEGNPNDPAISRMMIDTMVRYMTPRLVAAMGLLETTSVIHLQKDEVGLQLYPNPAVNEINISAAEEINSILVKDLNGRVIVHKEQLGDNHLISVSQLPAGMYLLEVGFKKGVVNEKLLVRR